MIKELVDFKYIEYNELFIDNLLDKGNAEVFKGTYNEKDIAIKKYEYDEFNINEIIFKELEIGSNTKSERLMKTYGYSYDKEKEYLYLIMEYINSSDLGKYISSYYDEDYEYCLSIETKLSIIKSVLKSIRDMWVEGIVHGDLKPLNLAIHRRNDEIFIKIIDYGTCEYDHRNLGFDKEYVCSTDGYVSTELDKTNIISHKSDIYALGVIIFEILCGFISTGDDYKTSRNMLLKELRALKQIYPDLEKIIRKCVDINPTNRPDIYKLIKIFDNYLNLRTK